MLYAPLTFSTRSTEMPLATGAQISDNGQALVSLKQNGRRVVQPSTGAAGEVFVGFADTQTSAVPVVPANAVKVEYIESVPANGILTIAKTPVAGTIIVNHAVTKAVIAITAATGTSVTVATTNAGAPVFVTYTYALTVTEARALVGDVQPGGFVGHTIGQVGVSQDGVVYTSCFDTSVDWYAATGVKLAAGGKVTNQAGSGVAITADVVQVPTVNYPFLGLAFRASV
jgi:hypothetical protein